MTRVIVVSTDFALKSGVAAQLSNNADFEVISTVFSVNQAAGVLNPKGANVIVLDLDGQDTTAEFLKRLTERFRLVVIIMGKHPGVPYILNGLNNVLNKPLVGNSFSMRSFCEEVTRRVGFINNAAAAQMAQMAQNTEGVPLTQRIVVMAASTGGTEALPVVFQRLPANMPPMLVVQHMPSLFTKQFAERLDKLSRVTVKEASDGDYLRKGLALLAPGDLHMKLVKRGGKLAVEVFNGEKMHGVRPAADITFNSVLGICGGNVVGAILTGMGADGARGLFELHGKGAKVIAQSKETCVVYGMPKAAVDMGAADYVLPLNDIADKIAALV